jgi:hypothetical protein
VWASDAEEEAECACVSKCDRLLDVPVSSLRSKPRLVSPLMLAGVKADGEMESAFGGCWANRACRPLHHVLQSPGVLALRCR